MPLYPSENFRWHASLYFPFIPQAVKLKFGTKQFSVFNQRTCWFLFVKGHWIFPETNWLPTRCWALVLKCYTIQMNTHWIQSSWWTKKHFLFGKLLFNLKHSEKAAERRKLWTVTKAFLEKDNLHGFSNLRLFYLSESLVGSIFTIMKFSFTNSASIKLKWETDNAAITLMTRNIYCLHFCYAYDDPLSLPQNIIGK